MPSHIAQQIRQKPAAGTRTIGVDFYGQFGDGATLLQGGTVTITSSPSGLTISAAAVTTAARRINNRNCAAGEAVTFLCAGGTAGTRYTIDISVPGAVSGVASSEVYPGKIYLDVT